MAKLKLFIFYDRRGTREVAKLELWSQFPGEFDERFSNTGRSAGYDDGRESLERFARRGHKLFRDKFRPGRVVCLGSLKPKHNAAS